MLLRKNILYAALFAALIPFFFVFLRLSEVKNLHIALILLPVLFLVIFNFRYSLFILVLALFVNYPVNVLQLSSLVLYLVFLSYFACFYDKDFGSLKNHLTLPIGIYLISVLPSFLNNQQPGYSIIFMSSLLGSFLLVHLLYSSGDKKLIRLFFIWFLVFSALNGITAVYEGLVIKKRAFGFSGIMFVDYVSVAIVITFIAMLLSRKKIYYLLLLSFYFLCTIVHQTRGVWFALGITLLFGLIYFLIMSKDYGLNRGKLSGLLTIIIFLGVGGYFLISEINPRIEQRAASLQKTEVKIDQEGYIDNSVVTRALIWHTAYNAFKAHPIIGIGSHSFAFQSKTYSTLNPFLYKKYVRGVTPHGTLFALLTEVGIVGFLGFVIFVGLTLKHAYKNIRLSVTEEDKRNSAILFFILVYITFSMIITDAWLFGSGAVLWGLVLGMSALQRKHLRSDEG